jgi:hypothetical protein
MAFIFLSRGGAGAGVTIHLPDRRAGYHAMVTLRVPAVDRFAGFQ